MRGDAGVSTGAPAPNPSRSELSPELAAALKARGYR